LHFFVTLQVVCHFAKPQKNKQKNPMSAVGTYFKSRCLYVSLYG